MNLEGIEKYTPNLVHSILECPMTWKSDLIAGLTTATLLIPQSMAYALLAGLPPEMGLYSAIIPLLLYSILGSVRELSVGPVAMDSLLVGTALSSLVLANVGDRILYASILSLMVGGVLVLLSMFKVGKYYSKIGNHLMSAFTTGAALLIIKSQIPSLIGLKSVELSFLFEASFYQRLHQPTLILSVISMIFFLLIKRIPRLPSAFLLISTAIIASKQFQLAQGFKISIVGLIPNQLPSFHMIDWHLFFQQQTLWQLLPASIVIAFVAFMEAIAIDKVMCDKHGEKLNANQELFSIGVSNIGGALFGGYPITGGLSRTAFNSQAGAKTAFASLVTVISVVFTLLFLTDFLSDLPKATLSVLIIFAVSQLIKLKLAQTLWRQNRFHALIWGITLFSTLYFGVQWGLLVGFLSELMLNRIWPKALVH